MRKQKLWLGITLSALTMGLLVGCGQKETVTTQPKEVVNEEVAQEESKEAEAEEDSKETEVAETEVPELEGYNLLWNDEFDGDSLNEDIWNRELRDPGWTNEELQEYTDSDENIYVEDGKLILKAVKTEKDGKDNGIRLYGLTNPALDITERQKWVDNIKEEGKHAKEEINEILMEMKTQEELNEEKIDNSANSLTNNTNAE